MEKTVILLPDSSLEELEECLKNILFGEEDKVNLMRALGLRIRTNDTDVGDDVDGSDLSSPGAKHSTDVIVKKEVIVEDSCSQETQQNESNCIEIQMKDETFETSHASIVAISAKLSEVKADTIVESDDHEVQTRKNNLNVNFENPEALKSDFKCPHCSVDFESKKALNHHIRKLCVSEAMVPYVENVGDQYMCKLCKYGTSRSRPMRKIREHIYTAHKLFTRLKCSQCDKKFYYKYELRKHAVVHTETNPDDVRKTVCAECGKNFKSFQMFKLHVVLRHGSEEERIKLLKFQCFGCDKRFLSKLNLTEHEQIHGERSVIPWPCPQCDKTLSSKRTLRTHIRHGHLGLKKSKTEEEKANLRANSIKKRLEKKAENGGMRTDEERRKGREWARRKRRNERIMKNDGKEDEEQL